MSDRISIKDKFVDKLKEELSDANLDTYYTDIDKQVFGKNLFLSQVETFPAITVGVGREGTVYQPGGFRWLNLDVYIRIYVRSDDSAGEQLEKIIDDIKTFIDLHEDLEYNITKPSGKSVAKKVTQSTVQEITTDEGVLQPYGVGEILISVMYNERNSRFIK